MAIARYALFGASRTRSVILSLMIQVSMSAIKPAPNPGLSGRFIAGTRSISAAEARS